MERSTYSMRNCSIKTLILDCWSFTDGRRIPYYRYLPKEIKLGYIGPKSTLRMTKWGVHEYLRQYLLTFLHCGEYNVVISGSFVHGLGLCVFQMLGLKKSTKHIIIDQASSRWGKRISIVFTALMNSANRIICYTTTQKKWWNKQLSLKKANFIPLVVDNSEITPSSIEKDYIFSAGRISRDYATLIEATKNIGTDVHIIAGRDTVTRKNNLEGLQLSDNIHVHYEVPYDQYIKLLRECKLVVLPLKDVNYACGQRVLLEAFAAGKPLIVTKTVATLDYVENNTTGIFVKANDHEELREKILLLLQSEDMRRCLGENARKMVDVKFNLQEMGKNIYKIICDTNS